MEIFTLEKGGNWAKTGFCKTFSHATGTFYSPYMLDIGEFTVIKNNAKSTCGLLEGMVRIHKNISMAS